MQHMPRNKRHWRAVAYLLTCERPGRFTDIRPSLTSIAGGKTSLTGWSCVRQERTVVGEPPVDTDRRCLEEPGEERQLLEMVGEAVRPKDGRSIRTGERVSHFKVGLAADYLPSVRREYSATLPLLLTASRRYPSSFSSYVQRSPSGTLATGSHSIGSMKRTLNSANPLIKREPLAGARGREEDSTHELGGQIGLADN
jgi:hypothetical protein